MSTVSSRLSTEYNRATRKGKYAINGKILRVDLSGNQMWVDEPPPEFYRTYLGGRGFVLYYLLSEMPAGADPLGPENLLVFAPGVLTGTVLPGSGRHGVGAKSPLTGALASGEAGGWWGSELKRAGFDAVVIQGQADRPVYLWIKDGTAEIRDAGRLWGMCTAECEVAIREELQDSNVQVAQIGPAGENLVRYACVMHNISRAAGRSGIGAVMGSKRLKAIAVRGSTALGLADRNLMGLTVKWIAAGYKSTMEWAVGGGTAGETQQLHDIGSTPVRNFMLPAFDKISEVDGKRLFELMLDGRDSCNVCPVHCKIVLKYEDKDGPAVDPRYGGPEYESIGALGPMCDVGDPVAVSKANELCEAYGLDTISTGGTIAFAMECVEKGIIARTSEDGFLPRFGDADSLIESIHRIAYRRGIGDKMAAGSSRMAQEIGPSAEGLVVVTKGQELPMHDPRLKNSFGLGYALSATGADHMHNMDDTFVNNPNSEHTARLKTMGIRAPFPLFGLPTEKIRGFIYDTAFMNFADCAVICDFFPYEFHHVVDALNGATGWDMTAQEIVDIGNRVVTMGRLFLLRESFTAADDKLPDRLFEAHSSGPIAGKALTREELAQAILTYYDLMGWNEAGIPSESAKRQLSLDWVVGGS